jgi:hypothetical protein
MPANRRRPNSDAMRALRVAEARPEQVRRQPASTLATHDLQPGREAAQRLAFTCRPATGRARAERRLPPRLPAPR